MTIGETIRKKTLVDRPYRYLIARRYMPEHHIGVVIPTRHKTLRWEAHYYLEIGYYSLGLYKQLRDAQSAIEQHYKRLRIMTDHAIPISKGIPEEEYIRINLSVVWGMPDGKHVSSYYRANLFLLGHKLRLSREIEYTIIEAISDIMEEYSNAGILPEAKDI